MTVSSVASTFTAESTGVEPVSPDSGANGAASGFDILLAGAKSDVENTTEGSHEESEASDNSGNSDRGTCATDATDQKPSDKPDPAKAGHEADLGGLVAVLSALAWTPPAPDAQDAATAPDAAVTAADDATTTPPTLDPTALLDLTTPPAPDASTLIELATDATPPPTTPPLDLPGAVRPAVDLPAPAPAPAHSAPPSGTYADTTGALPIERARSTQSSTPDGTATVAVAPLAAHAPTVSAAVEDVNTTTATVTLPPPAEQLVSVLTPLRATPNGTYTLHLELKPPELGRIEMRVEMRDGVLHAAIHAEHESSAQLVRDSLTEFRDRLNADGVNAGELTVSDGSVGSGGRNGHEAASTDPATGPAVVGPADEALPNPTVVVPEIEPEATSSLDVRV